MPTQSVAFQTIVRREIKRFTRIWTQTLLPSVITQTLYFIIFGAFIGSRIGRVHGIRYIDFLVPGLVMMSIINNSFSNVVSSFFSSKFQRSIEEILVSPTSEWVIMTGYIAGGMLRGMIVGVLVFIVSIVFTRPHVYHPGFIILFGLLTSAAFSLGGLMNAIFAKNFDDISFVPTFILTPLTYLGGVFYSIDRLSPLWRKVSQLNPILYMVNGFRYGFSGFSDVPVDISLLLLVLLVAALAAANLYLLRKGIGLKS